MTVTDERPNDKLLSEIDKCSDRKYFLDLLKSEPEVPFIEFAETLYLRSQSASTVTGYGQGIFKFRNMLREKNMTLAGLITELKQPNGLVYTILLEFLKYCNRMGWSAKSTFAYMNAVRQLFNYLEIEIDDNKFKNKIKMPRLIAAREEYPPNETIRRILNHCNPKIRTWILIMINAGLEPVDATKLKPKHFKFEESPVRITINRSKTGELIETFIDRETVALVQQIIKHHSLGQDDYIFIKGDYKDAKLKQLRGSYNLAVAKAGFGKIAYDPKTRQRSVILDKIDGRKTGKYHVKLWKKRWFSLAKSVSDVYIVQGMLGRSAYLQQYEATPLETRRELGSKILRKVSPYSDKADKKEVIGQIANAIGISPEALDENKLNELRGLFGSFATLPLEKIKQIKKLLGPD